MIGDILNFEWLNKLVKLLVENWLNLSIESKAGAALHFFIYDFMKIVILLAVMIYVIAFIRSYFPAEKTKQMLEKKKGIFGNIAASLLGTVTPFCSCSSIPMFIGLIEAGVPLGVTFSFLITSPIVNEAVVIILMGAFGIKSAILYIISGVAIGVTGGYIIGKLKLEGEIEPHVFNVKIKRKEIKKLNFKDRHIFAKDEVVTIIKKIWFYMMIGIAMGAVIHGWVPSDFLAKYAGKDNPFAVIIAVIMGVPLYSSATGMIPVAQALIAKGVSLGSAMAFMLAVVTLSLPEMIILRMVIKTKLIAVFVIITSIAIIVTGYMFNILEPFLK